jgi:hypothetical protein
MEKRGELTSSQIAMLVLSIAAFVIILIFLLLFLDIENQTDEEICRLSVLTRATSPDAVQSSLPLKCQTKKICISLTGQKCPQFLAEKSENIQINKNPDIGSEEIENIVAKEMLSCWNIMGEGKLDLFGEEISLANFFKTNKKATSCVICSRIAIAPELEAKKDILNKIDVNDYLETKQAPGSSFTYLQELTDRQVSAFPGKVKQEFQTNKEERTGTNQVAILFSQIRTETDPEKAAVDGVIVLGSGIIAGTWATGTSGGVIGLAASNPVASAILTTVGLGTTAGLRAYGAYRDQAISATYCGKFTGSKEEQKHGCSLINQVDYNNIPAINEHCQVIEGNP